MTDQNDNLTPAEPDTEAVATAVLLDVQLASVGDGLPPEI